MAMIETLQISPYQNRILSVPEAFDLALLGGRGSAKSYSLALLALRHVEQYQAKARVLYIRRTHSGTADFEALCRDLFAMIYGTAIRFNGQEGLFRFPNGATMEINQIEDASSSGKFQGRSFTLLLADEVGQFQTPDLLDRLRSNLRGPQGIPVRYVVAANPGGEGHSWLLKRHAWQIPWQPYVEPASGRTFVHCPGTFLDNPFISQIEYRKQLEASAPSDPELLRAWLEGDWTTHVRGAFFGQVLDQTRNLVERWPGIPERWPAPYIAHDWGSSAPSGTVIIAVSPGDTGPDGKWYPRDSLIAVDELATNEPGRLDRGMGYTVPQVAELIKEMCARWPNDRKYQKVRPTGPADDSIFARTGSGAGSISDEFRRAGVSFFPAKKADRLTGWNVMRRLLQDAGKPDLPGLYIARHCEYAWETLPTIGRDPRRPEDLDSRQNDHLADTLRYACLRQKREVKVGPLRI